MSLGMISLPARSRSPPGCNFRTRRPEDLVRYSLHHTRPNSYRKWNSAQRSQAWYDEWRHIRRLGGQQWWYLAHIIRRVFNKQRWESIGIKFTEHINLETIMEYEQYTANQIGSDHFSLLGSRLFGSRSPSLMVRRKYGQKKKFSCMQISISVTIRITKSCSCSCLQCATDEIALVDNRGAILNYYIE
jgi:hypothetical protein